MIPGLSLVAGNLNQEAKHLCLGSFLCPVSRMWLHEKRKISMPRESKGLTVFEVHVLYIWNWWIFFLGLGRSKSNEGRGATVKSLLGCCLWLLNKLSSRPPQVLLDLNGRDSTSEWDEKKIYFASSTLLSLFYSVDSPSLPSLPLILTESLLSDRHCSRHWHIETSI